MLTRLTGPSAPSAPTTDPSRGEIYHRIGVSTALWTDPGQFYTTCYSFLQGLYPWAEWSSDAPVEGGVLCLTRIVTGQLLGRDV
jgi:hypothetical protein